MYLQTVYLTLTQTSPCFYVSAVQVFGKHWEKEKLLVTSNFSFCHSVFYPYRELSAIFIKLEFIACSFFQFRRVKNLPFGKELRNITHVFANSTLKK